MNKILTVIIVTAVLVGGGAFFCGMEYAESKSPRRQSQIDFQNLQNLSSEERQQRLQELGLNAGTGFRGGPDGTRMAGAGLIAGEIISKDDISITIKLQDGGSRIIYLSDSTEITKLVSGALENLEIGKDIGVNGSPNPDGSITAQSIQLR